MIHTYQMGCTLGLIMSVSERGVIGSDWEQIDDFIGEMDFVVGGNTEKVPLHLFEFSVVADTKWFEHVREKFNAREVDCRHDHPVDQVKVARKTWKNKCSNCGKDLLFFDEVDMTDGRRIKFKRR